MENQLVWKDVFNIGIKIIDDEHQRLFMIINKLFALKEEEKRSRKVCQEGIKYFKEHALKHFEAEERYMELIAYEGIDVHKRLHRDFRENSLPALERELEREDYSPAAVDHFLAVCAGWLIGHTLTEDKAIAGEKRSRWAELLPEEELKAMKKVIIKLLEDMFRLKAQVISDSYSGEEFGESVYYRLVYGRKEDDEKWEILLALEDRILLSTIGKLMGTKSDKLDIILLNAARYMECQLVRRVMEHYPSISSYEMMEEDFLTYEQFREIFEKKQPQVSLLFDTNEGYFSYCVIAPHLPEGGIGEKYFIEKEKQEKKKILVVDDSSTTRLGMELLLAENYDVSEVSSGAAAIRAITLERPDLVLLDYEMPVCDGRHVLEMLRAEKEFSDIPVIFLTSRDDQESVKNVLSLNADGYLLKYLKPADIKKRIDGYFSRKEA
ncbi:MAG: response regulator [Lachnospiraceae bacterium]|nr:response regulator [Lachnospiraceae bacterium]MCI9590353.1 response regulator [Lachnospiraceae bacterium]